nr:MAG TPA: hypothetical protein [Caudoviricetes sp.]
MCYISSDYIFISLEMCYHFEPLLRFYFHFRNSR